MKQAAWFEQFADEFRILAFDPIGSAWLEELASAVYPFAGNMEPAQAAKLVYTAMMFEPAECVELARVGRPDGLRMRGDRWLARCLGPWAPR